MHMCVHARKNWRYQKWWHKPGLIWVRNQIWGRDIQELVDSQCRDGANMQYMKYLSKSYNLATSTLRAYSSSQSSSLWRFMIRKTHTITHEPCVRQLNTNVCSNESAIFPNFFLRRSTKYLENGVNNYCSCSLIPRHSKNRKERLVHTIRACAKSPW